MCIIFLTVNWHISKQWASLKYMRHDKDLDVTSVALLVGSMELM